MDTQGALGHLGVLGTLSGSCGENRFSKYQCGLKKGYNNQNALLSLHYEPMTKKVCGALLTDLSKTFDCISHDLPMIKLHATEFDRHELKVTHDYLSGKSQKTKVGSSFSDFSVIF